MIETSTRCACGSCVQLTDYHGTWHATCPFCYEPVPDGADLALLEGRGSVPEDALADWIRKFEDIGAEPEWRPTELSTFVVPTAPEGFACAYLGLTFDSLNAAESWAAEQPAHSSERAPIIYMPNAGQRLASNDT